jgi:hypothetical protein
MIFYTTKITIARNTAPTGGAHPQDDYQQIAADVPAVITTPSKRVNATPQALQTTAREYLRVDPDVNIKPGDQVTDQNTGYSYFVEWTDASSTTVAPDLDSKRAALTRVPTSIA